MFCVRYYKVVITTVLGDNCCVIVIVNVCVFYTFFCVFQNFFRTTTTTKSKVFKQQNNNTTAIYCLFDALSRQVVPRKRYRKHDIHIWHPCFQLLQTRLPKYIVDSMYNNMHCTPRLGSSGLFTGRKLSNTNEHYTVHCTVLYS